MQMMKHNSWEAPIPTRFSTGVPSSGSLWTQRITL